MLWGLTSPGPTFGARMVDQEPDEVQEQARHPGHRRRWSSLTPEERRAYVEPAIEGKRRVGTDSHIRAIVARAGKLTPEQIATLRALLPPPQDEADAEKSA